MKILSSVLLRSLAALFVLGAISACSSTEERDTPEDNRPVVVTQPAPLPAPSPSPDTRRNETTAGTAMEDDTDLGAASGGRGR